MKFADVTYQDWDLDDSHVFENNQIQRLVRERTIDANRNRLRHIYSLAR